jgi:hypothetical protein
VEDADVPGIVDHSQDAEGGTAGAENKQLPAHVTMQDSHEPAPQQVVNESEPHEQVVDQGEDTQQMHRVNPLEIDQADTYIVSRLPSHEESLPVFVSCNSSELLRRLPQGACVEASGDPQVVDGSEMLPIKPEGAVEIHCLQKQTSLESDLYLISRLPAGEDDLPVFESCESSVLLSRLPKGACVEAAGLPRDVDGYAMLPIKPYGAVDLLFLQVRTRVEASASVSFDKTRTLIRLALDCALASGQLNELVAAVPLLASGDSAVGEFAPLAGSSRPDAPVEEIESCLDLLPCTSRMPRVGDEVVALNGRFRQGKDVHGKAKAWKLQPEHVARVVDVDADGDFRLSNPDGVESSYLQRKFYSYVLPNADMYVVSRLPADADAVTVFESCSSYQKLLPRELAKGAHVEAAGDPQVVDSCEMLPIKPEGAVEILFLQRMVRSVKLTHNKTRYMIRTALDRALASGELTEAVQTLVFSKSKETCGGSIDDIRLRIRAALDNAATSGMLGEIIDMVAAARDDFSDCDDVPGHLGTTPARRDRQDEDALGELVGAGMDCSPVIAASPAVDYDESTMLDFLNADGSYPDDLDLIPPGYAVPRDNRDDELALDMLAPAVFQPSALPERTGWWPQKRSGYKVHPAPALAPSGFSPPGLLPPSTLPSAPGYSLRDPPARCPHHSQTQRVYISARHVGPPCGGVDIDSMRDTGPVRHRIVQRIYADGRVVGAPKVERLIARGKAVEHPPLMAGLLPSTETSGWCHVRFDSAAELAHDLQFDLNGEGNFVITQVSAGGVAQRAGVYPGFRLGAVNGDSIRLRERFMAAISDGLGGKVPIALDLFSPIPQCHGVPSLGDAVARTPLAPPGIIDSLL